MRLTLVDRITELQPHSHIQAVKSLSLMEDYLQDHFPRFPVMPGVLMLESLYQTAAWLVRASDEFAHSMVTLAATNNVKFSDFVEPGQTLQIGVQWEGDQDQQCKLKCQGTIGPRVAVRARLVLRRWNLSDEMPGREVTDQRMIAQLRRKFDLLYRPATSET